MCFSKNQNKVGQSYSLNIPKCLPKRPQHILQEVLEASTEKTHTASKRVHFYLWLGWTWWPTCMTLLAHSLASMIPIRKVRGLPDGTCQLAAGGCRCRGLSAELSPHSCSNGQCQISMQIPMSFTSGCAIRSAGTQQTLNRHSTGTQQSLIKIICFSMFNVIKRNYHTF